MRLSSRLSRYSHLQGAALCPVNANETDLAAQCIAARGQAEDLLRLLRQHAGDPALTLRLNAQYALVVRTSLSAHNSLVPAQAMRHKREAIEGAAEQDERRRQAVEQCMLIMANPEIERMTASPGAAREEWPGAAPEAAPDETPVAPPVPHGKQDTLENVSEYVTNSHGVAFDTRMSDHFRDHEEEMELREQVGKAVAGLHLVWRDVSADGRESHGTRGQPSRPADCPDWVRSGQPTPKDERVGYC